MTFLLFTTIALAQDPSITKDPSAQPQQEENLQEQRSTSSESNIMLDAEIRGMPEDDAEVVNQILSDQSPSKNIEQYLLNTEADEKEVGFTQPSSSVPILVNPEASGLWVILGLCLIILVAVQFFVKKRAHKAPELTMLARSMFGKEGSLAIIEVNSGIGARQMLVGLNSGSAPRLIMDLTDPQKLQLSSEGDLSVGDLSSGLQQFLSSDRTISKSSSKSKSPRTKKSHARSEGAGTVNREVLSKQTLKMKGSQMEQVVAEPVDLSFEEETPRSASGRSARSSQIREIRREEISNKDVSFVEDESIWTKEFERALRKEEQVDESPYEE